VGRGLAGDRIDQRGPRRLLLESHFVGERHPPVRAGTLLEQPPALREPLEPNAVWVVVDGKVNRRQVDLGVRTPGFVEVTKGVTAGEQLVVGGLELLAPGAPVMARVVERKPPATADPRPR